MKQTKVILLLLVILICTSYVLATSETFITKGNIETRNNQVTVNTESQTYTLSCEQNMSIPFTIDLQRDIEDISCPGFNYSKISEYQTLNNFTLNCQGLNETEMTDFLNNKIDSKFADDRDYFENTYLATGIEINKYESDKMRAESQRDTCNNIYANLNKTFHSMNQTYYEDKQDLKNTIKNERFVMIGLIIICVLMFVVGYVDLKKLASFTK